MVAAHGELLPSRPDGMPAPLQCPACGHDAEPDARFCETCGAGLARACPGCGRAVKAQARFCPGCGSSLDPGAAATPEPEPTHARMRAAPEGERRQLTVLFCDLVGSTEIAARLDPEEWGDIAAQYQRTAADAVTRLGGYVAKYLGDGILALFGYPRAHDDDAERAVRAGLAIVEAVGALNAEVVPASHSADSPVTIAVRVGIHTGPAVISHGVGDVPDAFGETPNLAARVQAAAEPDSVLITAATQRLVAGLFVVDDRRTQQLKGIREPVSLYRVRQPSGVRSRLHVHGARLTRFVGRELEIGTLHDRWERVLEREGQTVLVSGEAGVGKSRLIHALHERLAEEPHTWLECRCGPYTQHSAFHPVIELVEQGLGFTPTDTPADKIARLEGGLRRSGFALADVVPLFAAFLSIPLTDGYAPPAMSPELQRRKTIEALVAWSLALGELQPVVLLVEDLHWCDPSSLELLGRLIEQSPTARLLAVFTARPEFSSPWPARSNLTTLPLNRLTHRQAGDMIAALSPKGSLPAALVAAIISRADGIPLHVEELTRTVLESGLLADRDGRYELTGSLDDLGIPATLQDSLMARLDRLSAAKEVAQIAAVLGREFSYALLSAVAPLDGAAVRHGLARLVEAELLFERGFPPDATYTFKHALVQETAYQSLLRRTRQQLHARTAQVLEAHFPDRAAAEPEVLARHFEAAGLIDQAVANHQRAGEQAAWRSAHEEAVAHLRKAIALLETLPEGGPRNARELPLQLTIGSSLIAVRGYSHGETEAAHQRALLLCERTGDASHEARVLAALSIFHTNGGNSKPGVELAERVLAIGRRTGSEAQLLLGHVQLAIPYTWEGKFTASLEHAERAIALYDPARHATLASWLGGDQGVAAWQTGSWDLWFLGYPDRALEHARSGLALARRLAHPFSLAQAVMAEAVCHSLRRDTARQLHVAEELIALGETHNFPLFHGVGKVFRGAARVASVGDESGLAEIMDGVAMAAVTGVQAGAPGNIGAVGEAQRAVGRHADALNTVEAALALSGQTGHAFYDAELYRLKGELLAATGASLADAEGCLRRAVDIARAQEARSWELRASASLAGLLGRSGRSEEGKALLAPILGWFTEGLDTADLVEAQALLATLG